jgi:hypothetical protein
MTERWNQTLQQVADLQVRINSSAVSCCMFCLLAGALGIGVIFLLCEAQREYFYGLSNCVDRADLFTLFQNGACSQR